MITLFPFRAHRLVCMARKELREIAGATFRLCIHPNTARPQKVTYFDYSPTTKKVTSILPGWGSSGRDAKTLHRFRRLMSPADEKDVKLLMFMAQKMSRRKNRNARST